MSWVILFRITSPEDAAMDTVTQPQKSSPHPLILAAAAAVIAVCLAVIAVLAGWLPRNKATETPPAALEQPAPLPADTAAANAQKLPSETPAKATATTTSATSAPSAAAKAESVAKAPVKHAAKSSSAASTSGVATAEKTPPAPAKCMDCGEIVDVRSKTVEPEGSGLGGVAGGVVGGLLGNQVGAGNGRTAATVAGVVGGALLGNKIEKTVKKKEVYEVVVRYEDGTTQTFPSDTPPAWRIGDKVRLENGVLVSR
jgi:outer membrane lipoprotein SlyB